MFYPSIWCFEIRVEIFHQVRHVSDASTRTTRIDLQWNMVKHSRNTFFVYWWHIAWNRCKCHRFGKYHTMFLGHVDLDPSVILKRDSIFQFRCVNTFSFRRSPRGARGQVKGRTHFATDGQWYCDSTTPRRTVMSSDQVLKRYVRAAKEATHAFLFRRKYCTGLLPTLCYPESRKLCSYKGLVHNWCSST
jgi:hypothetical protein